MSFVIGNRGGEGWIPSHPCYRTIVKVVDSTHTIYLRQPKDIFYLPIEGRIKLKRCLQKQSSI